MTSGSSRRAALKPLANESQSVPISRWFTTHLECQCKYSIGPERQHSQVRSQLCAVLEAVVSQQLLPKADKSGYVVAYEIMFRNKTIQRMIRDKDQDSIAQYLETEEAMREGMVSMDTTIKMLYKKGLITRDTALDYSFDRKRMSQVLK